MTDFGKNRNRSRKHLSCSIPSRLASDSFVPTRRSSSSVKRVVPGDMLILTSSYYLLRYFVLLHADNGVTLRRRRLPRDCVVFSSEALTVTQASLTGELIPVEKRPRLDLPSPEFKFDMLDNENICLGRNFGRYR